MHVGLECKAVIGEGLLGGQGGASRTLCARLGVEDLNDLRAYYTVRAEDLAGVPCDSTDVHVITGTDILDTPVDDMELFD